jgi:hypothetical protein
LKGRNTAGGGSRWAVARVAAMMPSRSPTCCARWRADPRTPKSSSCCSSFFLAAGLLPARRAHRGGHRTRGAAPGAAAQAHRRDVRALMAVMACRGSRRATLVFKDVTRPRDSAHLVLDPVLAGRSAARWLLFLLFKRLNDDGVIGVLGVPVAAADFCARADRWRSPRAAQRYAAPTAGLR